MTELVVVSTVLSVAWGVVALVGLRLRRRPAMARIAALGMLLTIAHTATTFWAPAAPLLVGAWLCYALSLPTGRLTSVARRVLCALALAATGAWTITLASSGAKAADTHAVLLAALAASAIAAIGASLRGRGAASEDRRAVQWLAAGSVLSTTWALGCLTAHVMAGEPRALLAAVALGLVFIPFAQLLAMLVPGTRAAAIALLESMAASGVVALVAVVYLVVVVGINGSPHGHERSVLLASLAAATTVALLAVPVRRRIVRVAGALVGDRGSSRREVVTGFGARMSRAVPMDELMLQLAESLQASIAPGGVEIWTGLDGQLNRTVSVPNRGPSRITLAEQERIVVGRARIGGPAWTSVWLPMLSALESAEGDHRAVPVAHLGDLLGLILVRRSAGVPTFTEDDEAALVELARQLGLALHNVRLDSALQASLAELAQRNEELQASRLRIVAAADTSRRAIERNLHDGAQQHLVALAVKLGLARQIAEDGDVPTVLGLLADLREDVQTTIGELRELAHGIYPPLLRDRGLAEALRAASARSPLACTIEVDLPGRYDEQVETAAYFCCLEAMQNAGKHAGDGATIAVHVHGEGGVLSFELADDGVGFDASAAALGHGFLNMADRLGAIGGTLAVASTPGRGTTVSASIPARPKTAGDGPAATTRGLNGSNVADIVAGTDPAHTTQ